jgi:hypothetical protein
MKFGTRASSIGNRLLALGLERFEVEQMRRIQPPSIALGGEEIASNIGGRGIRGGLSGYV